MLKRRDQNPHKAFFCYNVNMGYKYILLLTFSALIFSGFLVGNVQATVGGPTFIYDFKYNPQNESVYYTEVSLSGRGCPPELMKISLVSGQSQVVFSCSDGEKLMSNGAYEFSSVSMAINNIVSDFNSLAQINLKKNNISIDVNFVDYKKYSPEIDEIQNANFIASIYQDGKKVSDFPITGCNLEQPFIFAGYAIPGFNKKIVLLLSAKGDCWEGGYIYESLHVIGGLDNLDKTYFSNDYKGASALIPNEGTLVIFEADKPNNSTSDIPSQETGDPNNPQSIYFYLIGGFVVFVSILIGIMLDRLFVKKSDI